MASTPTRILTFAEFDKLPEPVSGRYELRHGETVLVPPPKHAHYLMQRRLRRLLEAAAGAQGEVEIEPGFRPQPDHEFWIADVAFVSRERWDAIPSNGDLMGAPELVAEVLSPSNTMAELIEKKNDLPGKWSPRILGCRHTAPARRSIA